MQLAYLKSHLSVRKQTTTVAVYAETGQFPLLIRQKLSAVRYCFRILQLPMSNMLYERLQTIMELSNNGQHNWFTKVQNILTECNAANTVTDFVSGQNSGKLDHIAKAIKNTLYMNAQHKLLETIHVGVSFPKLRTYSLIVNTVFM